MCVVSLKGIGILNISTQVYTFYPSIVIQHDAPFAVELVYQKHINSVVFFSQEKLLTFFNIDTEIYTTSVLDETGYNLKIYKHYVLFVGDQSHRLYFNTNRSRISCLYFDVNHENTIYYIRADFAFYQRKNNKLSKIELFDGHSANYTVQCAKKKVWIPSVVNQELTGFSSIKYKNHLQQFYTFQSPSPLSFPISTIVNVYIFGKNTKKYVWFVIITTDGVAHVYDKSAYLIMSLTNISNAIGKVYNNHLYLYCFKNQNTTAPVDSNENKQLFIISRTGTIKTVYPFNNRHYRFKIPADPIKYPDKCADQFIEIKDRLGFLSTYKEYTYVIGDTEVHSTPVNRNALNVFSDISSDSSCESDSCSDSQLESSSKPDHSHNISMKLHAQPQQRQRIHRRQRRRLPLQHKQKKSNRKKSKSRSRSRSHSHSRSRSHSHSRSSSSSHSHSHSRSISHSHSRSRSHSRSSSSSDDEYPIISVQ
jgi:hypothetical protein